MRRWSFALVVGALLAAGSAGAVGAAAGTQISNVAYMDVSDGLGSSTVSTTPVVINVQQVAALSVTPDGTVAAPGQTVTVFPGQSGTLNYTVTNTGNGSDTINLQALVAGGVASAGNISGIYVDTNSDGVYTPGTDQAVTSLTLAADTSRLVFVSYAVPSGTTGQSASGASHLINLSAASAFDASKTDSGNVGRVLVGRVIDLTYAPSELKFLTAGGSVSFTNTLTNTGNTALLPAEITAAVTRATDRGGSVIPDAFTVSYQVTGGQGGTQSGSDLESLLNAAIGTGLNAGATLTVTSTVSAAAAALDTDTLTLTAQLYSEVAASSSVINQALTTDLQARDADQARVRRGVGTVSKTQAACDSGYASCPTSGSVASFNALPGKQVIYFLTAMNSGTGTLYNVRLRDVLPAGFLISHVGVKTTVSGTLLYSRNGTTWSSTLSGLGAFAPGDSLIVGVDTNSDNQISSADQMAASDTIRMTIAGTVQDTAQTSASPTFDLSKLP